MQLPHFTSFIDLCILFSIFLTSLASLMQRELCLGEMETKWIKIQTKATPFLFLIACHQPRRVTFLHKIITNCNLQWCWCERALFL